MWGRGMVDGVVQEEVKKITNVINSLSKNWLSLIWKKDDEIHEIHIIFIDIAFYLFLFD